MGFWDSIKGIFVAGEAALNVGDEVLYKAGEDYVPPHHSAKIKEVLQDGSFLLEMDHSPQTLLYRITPAADCIKVVK